MKNQAVQFNERTAAAIRAADSLTRSECCDDTPQGNFFTLDMQRHYKGPFAVEYDTGGTLKIGNNEFAHRDIFNFNPLVVKYRQMEIIAGERSLEIPSGGLLYAALIISHSENYEQISWSFKIDAFPFSAYDSETDVIPLARISENGIVQIQYGAAILA